jgi:hypothetical protein
MSQQVSVESHNSYGWIRPDADACYLCGKKEYATPVDGFQVCECDKCERPVCENCAETDVDCVGDPPQYVTTQWQCEQECLVDIRIPITVTFDFFIDNVKPDEIEETIRALEMAVVEARFEDHIPFDGDLGSGTRWQPADADMENIGVRTHADSGSFYSWKRKVA